MFEITRDGLWKGIQINTPAVDQSLSGGWRRMSGMFGAVQSLYAV
jgi:hypothetical protein